MVAPLRLEGASSDEGPGAGAGSPAATLVTVDVPLPLAPRVVDMNEGDERGGRVAGVVSTTGAVVDVPLPMEWHGDACHALGLDTALGCVRMLQVQPGVGDGPLVVVPPADGQEDDGASHGPTRSIMTSSSRGALRCVFCCALCVVVGGTCDVWLLKRVCMYSQGGACKG